MLRAGIDSGYRQPALPWLQAEPGRQLAAQAAQDVAGKLAHAGVPRAEAEGDAAIVAHLDVSPPQELPVALRRGGGGGGPPRSAAVCVALRRLALYFPLSHALTLWPRLCLHGTQRSVSGRLPRGHHAGCSTKCAPAESIIRLLTLLHDLKIALTITTLGR